MLSNHDLFKPIFVALLLTIKLVTGGGAAGSSLSYHLHEFSSASYPVDITLFETSSRIGGRTTTVNALDDPRYPAELGASIFVKINHILYESAKRFNLHTIEPSLDTSNSSVSHSYWSIGVWQGNYFVYRQIGSSWSWLWDAAQLLWSYGLAPIKTQRLMKDRVGRFLKMYDAPVYPFQSLTEVVAQLGLLESTAMTGAQLLKAEGVGEKFANEIIQASTRVNYGQNLGVIHGLETMVCMATDGAMSVEGGNWQIFDNMVYASRATVKLNTTVKEVTRVEGGGYAVRSTEILLENPTQQEVVEERFDTVVLASPYQFSHVTFTPPLDNPPDEIPYVTLCVTLLTSPHRLHFMQENPNDVPEMVLTTLPEGMDLGSERGKNSTGGTWFWSVSTLKIIQMDNGKQQYLYKIFSPEPMRITHLIELFGSYLWCSGRNVGRDEPMGNMCKEHVSWSYEKVWHAYPYELPRLTFQDIRLEGAEEGGGKGVWYTSGIESFISTMETSALMGKNVARLIVDELQKA